MQAAATDTSKPERTTLYVKAGPDGCSLGDCPFAHSVQMALQLKGVDYDVVPCTQETKPQWLLEEVDGKMPCVYHAGVPHIETSEILTWIEQEFPEPSLAPPENLNISDNFRSFFGLFPSLARYTKNTDPGQDADLKLDLQIKLSSLRAVLGQVSGDFLCGEQPTILDCDLLAKLYVMENATAHFKGFSLADFPETDEVRMYYEKGSVLKEFTAGAYPPDVCTWGWGEARGNA